jgi:hypothetical protein
MQLRPYQKEIVKKGYQILRDFKILYLALEMRLGKTFISLSIAELLNVKRVLFVTKKKAISSVEKDYSETGYKFFLNIVNYEQLHKITGNYDLIICDEAHNGIAAYPKPSVRANKLKAIVKDKPLILLSATPGTETYAQLYHQFWISENTPFMFHKNFYKWAKDYIDVKEKMINGYMIRDYKKAKVEKIKAACDHLFISRTQKEAEFKSEISEEIIEVDIDNRIYSLAEKLLKEKYHQFTDGKEVVCDTAAKLLNKLQQVYSGTVITEDGTRKILDRSKALFIRENYGLYKIGIFYLFQSEGQLLKQIFYNRWTEDPEEFNKSENLIFLGQIQSSSQGVNLSTADYLIYYNIHHSGTLYLQSRSRAQFKEREKDSQIIWIVSKNGIEKKIYDIVRKKKKYNSYYFERDYKINSFMGAKC